MLNLTLNKFRDIGDYKRNIDDHKYVQKPINKVNTTASRLAEIEIEKYIARLFEENKENWKNLYIIVMVIYLLKLKVRFTRF